MPKAETFGVGGGCGGGETRAGPVLSLSSTGRGGVSCEGHARSEAEPSHGDPQNWPLHTKSGLQLVSESLHRGTHLPARASHETRPRETRASGVMGTRRLVEAEALMAHGRSTRCANRSAGPRDPLVGQRSQVRADLRLGSHSRLQAGCVGCSNLGPLGDGRADLDQCLGVSRRRAVQRATSMWPTASPCWRTAIPCWSACRRVEGERAQHSGIREARAGQHWVALPLAGSLRAGA